MADLLSRVFNRDLAPQIFGHLGEADRDSCRVVCKTWKKLIDLSFPIVIAHNGTQEEGQRIDARLVHHLAFRRLGDTRFDPDAQLNGPITFCLHPPSVARVECVWRTEHHTWLGSALKDHYLRATKDYMTSQAEKRRQWLLLRSAYSMSAGGGGSPPPFDLGALFRERQPQLVEMNLKLLSAGWFTCERDRFPFSLGGGGGGLRLLNLESSLLKIDFAELRHKVSEPRKKSWWWLVGAALACLAVAALWYGCRAWKRPKVATGMTGQGLVTSALTLSDGKKVRDMVFAK